MSGNDRTIPHKPSKQLPERYKILRPYREGGIGEVLIALDHELHREVALKRIRPVYADIPHYRSRFVLEAEITGGLEHPGIVPVYGLGQHINGRPYYAMRLVRGSTLKSAIEQFHQQDLTERDPGERSLELRKLLSRFNQVCETLHFAHTKGVVHRDVKPANVMLGEFGETLVVDWGLAKLADDGAIDGTIAGMLRPPSAFACSATQSGSTPGTPAYMSPEQAAGAAATFSSDVYGLGATLYTLLTGRPPFDLDRDSDVQEAQAQRARQLERALTADEEWETAVAIILAKVRQGSFPEPGTLHAKVPQSLEAICLKAMALRPSDRFASAREMAQQVEIWLSEEPLAAWKAAVDYFKQLTAEYPHIPAYREGLARNLANWGLVLSGMGRLQPAEMAFRGAIEEYAKLIDSQPRHVSYWAELAQIRLLFSRVLANLGQAAAAERERRDSDGTLMKLAELTAAEKQYRTNLASVLYTLGHSPDEVAQRLERSPRPHAASQTMDHVVAFDPARDDAATIDLPSPDDLATDQPKIAARYELIRILGRGGMSTVWLAHDVDLRRQVVLKQLDRMPADSYTLRRFLREPRITAQLDHPGIPAIYGVGYRAEDEAPFFAMKWVRGVTLLEAIQRYHDGRVQSDDNGMRRLLSAFVQICHVLCHAHAQGVVHRDPKPSNVLIEEDGRVVVIDWGLARTIGTDKPNDEDDTLEAEGAIMGTPAYMSPEAARGEVESIDQRSDVFSLGATLFHLLAGRTVFSAQNRLEDVLEKLAAGDIPSLHDVAAHVSPALDSICQKAMSASPVHRYPSTKELAGDVADYLATW